MTSIPDPNAPDPGRIIDDRPMTREQKIDAAVRAALAKGEITVELEPTGFIVSGKSRPVWGAVAREYRAQWL